MSRATAGLAGLLSAAFALGVTELAAGVLPGGRSPFVAVGDAAISLTPGSVVRFAIDTFGGTNRLVLLVSMTTVMAVAGVLIGIGAARRRWVGVVGIAAFGMLGAAAGLADPEMSAPVAVLAPVAGAAAGIAALFGMLRLAVAAVAPDSTLSAALPGVTAERDPALPAAAPSPAAASSPGQRPITADPRQPPASRRAFLRLAGTIAGGAAAATLVGRSLQARTTTEVGRSQTMLQTATTPLAAPTAANTVEVPGVSPLITPNDEFFRIDTALSVPRVDPGSHRIRITGMVDNPFELTYDELLDLADTEAYVTLSCVSNEVGGDLVGHAKWLGVPLSDLLERAGVQAGATQLVGRSVDGWTSGFPVEAAIDGRTALVAVGMNGEPLPPRHGFPVRLVIAGLYGYVSNTKWLSEIELTTFEAHDAYWIPRGWSAEGPIKTQSRIDVPSPGSSVAAGRVMVAGVAWADERGVTAVEVAIDDGPWQPADLAAALSTTSWRQWSMVWDAGPGDHLLRVRASDADGQPQTAERTQPAPDGATGHHTVRVTVA